MLDDAFSIKQSCPLEYGARRHSFNIDCANSTSLNYDLLITMLSDLTFQTAVGVLNLCNGEQLRYISNTNQLSHYTQDIIPGQYEGGFKLWECTIDLANYMTTVSHLFKGKRVLEIGCGHGLLGILAFKLGASEVCLQDYNQDVIEKLTHSTVMLNCGSDKSFTFLYGDWTQLKCVAEPYDVIIGSQVIYAESNYPKIVKCVQEFMNLQGCCLLANKVYYFGVGGTMVGFKKSLESLSKLRCESILKINPEKGGNKKQIVKITY